MKMVYLSFKDNSDKHYEQKCCQVQTLQFLKETALLFLNLQSTTCYNILNNRCYKILNVPKY